MRYKLLIGLITLALLLIGTSTAVIQDTKCSDFVETKDLLVQKKADLKIQYNNVKFWDVCTSEYQTSAIRYSDAYNWPSFERWVFPSGTIKGKIHHGYLGGVSLDYYICTDGRAWIYQRSGGGMGYGVGNSMHFCNTIF